MESAGGSTLATWFKVVKTDGVLLNALAAGVIFEIKGAAIGTAGLHTAGVRKRRSIVARIVWMGELRSDGLS